MMGGTSVWLLNFCTIIKPGFLPFGFYWVSTALLSIMGFVQF